MRMVENLRSTVRPSPLATAGRSGSARGSRRSASRRWAGPARVSLWSSAFTSSDQAIPQALAAASESKPSSGTQSDLTYLTRASTFPFDFRVRGGCGDGTEVVMSGQPDQVRVEDRETHYEVV